MREGRGGEERMRQNEKREVEKRGKERTRFRLREEKGDKWRV